MAGAVHQSENPFMQGNNYEPTQEHYQYKSVEDAQGNALLHNPQAFPNDEVPNAGGWADHYKASSPDELQRDQIGSQYIDGDEREGHYHHNYHREMPHPRRQSLPNYRWQSERHIVQTRPPPPAAQPAIADASTLQIMMFQQHIFMQQAQLASQVGGGGAGNAVQLQMIQAQMAVQNCQNGGGSKNVQNCGQQVRQVANGSPRIRPRRFMRAPPARLNSITNLPVPPAPSNNDQWEGWQEATIILCLVIMAGIYMTVNASAAAVTPSKSSSRSSSASKSSSSRTSSSSSSQAK